MLEKSGDYMLMAHEAKSTTDTRKKGGNFRLAARNKGLTAELAAIWFDRMRGLDDAKKDDPIFGPWVKFAALPADKFAASAPALAQEIASSTTVTPALAKPFAAKTPASLKEVANIYTETFGALHEKLKLGEFQPYKGRRDRFDVSKTQVKLADPDLDTLRQQLYASDSAMLPDEQNMARALGNQFTTQEGAIRSKISLLELTHPGAPLKAMSFVDRDKPHDSPVLVRGEPENRGPIVPRQFLALLSGENRKPFAEGSGRLEMAKLIASRDNPLTARVIANRVWQWHFGQAIVRTVSDFGTRSEPPTHPELLDYLATSLIDHGWSIKKLNKLIVMSGAYQQDSVANPAGMAIDPTNQWVWRANIQRLDFEEVRDSLLTFGAKLDLTMGGQPFALAGASTVNTKGRYSIDIDAMKGNANRRTVYAFIDRSGLPEMFNTFDFANPDMTTGERIMTTVPQQALFMMNSPFIVEQVKSILALPDVAAAKSDEERVRLIFRRLYQRAPRPEELELAKQYLDAESTDPTTAGSPAPEAPSAEPADPAQAKLARKAAAEAAAQMQPLTPWERYTQVVLLTNELVFVN
jgi:hypothetical protein